MQVTALLVAPLTLSGTASAQTIPDSVGKSSSGLPPILINVGFEPPLNGQIPLDTAFHDETGQSVRLGDYFGQQKPVLLALVYYGCPMLCNQVEQGVVGALKMLSFNAGRDYEVVFVGFDPRESPDMAAQKKEAALKHYGRRETASGASALATSGSPVPSATPTRFTESTPERSSRLRSP